jgi:hypothetical protein
LSYPSYEEQSWRNSAALIRELDKAFREKENLLVISRPESYCFPAYLFYDGNYHLNAEGRTRRTEQLLDDLRTSGIFFWRGVGKIVTTKRGIYQNRCFGGIQKRKGNYGAAGSGVTDILLARLAKTGMKTR